MLQRIAAALGVPMDILVEPKEG
ncbi:hypothetical protein ACTMU2_38415 [Cupriavidus basilensis]